MAVGSMSGLYYEINQICMDIIKGCFRWDSKIMILFVGMNFKKEDHTFPTLVINSNPLHCSSCCLVGRKYKITNCIAVNSMLGLYYESNMYKYDKRLF